MKKLVVSALIVIIACTAVNIKGVSAGTSSVLQIACTTDANCVSVKNATCDTTTTHNCTCTGAFKISNSICALKVLGDNCSSDPECVGVEHATCNTSSSHKCWCTGVYKQTGVLGSACTSANESAACTVKNSKCDTKKCACDKGFFEEAVDTCVMVLGSACTGTSACTGDANSNCTSSVCACKDWFAEKNDVCTRTVSGTVCTTKGVECKTITNAECDTTAKKCKCSPGFTMNVDACAAENAAATFSVGGISLALYGFLAVVKILG